MRIAVIGAGHWGKNHVRTLHEMKELGAVAELSPKLREAVATQYPNVRVESDVASVLKSDIPAVVIATPVATHFNLARDAILAGKDVLVEKPMTMNAAEAEELRRLAEAHGRVLMVGHLLLYQPAIAWIAGALKQGLIGDVWSLHQERLNLGKARSVENALWSLGVHDMAVLLHLVGAAPVKVFATGQSTLQAGIEDDVHVHLRFPSGAHAHLHCSWLWPERRRQLTVIGSNGMLVYDELAQTVTLHRKGIHADLTNRDEGAEVVFQGHGEPLRLELEHFLSCIETRAQPRSDAQQGADVVAVIDAAIHQLVTP